MLETFHIPKSYLNNRKFIDTKTIFSKKILVISKVEILTVFITVNYDVNHICLEIKLFKNSHRRKRLIALFPMPG